MKFVRNVLVMVCILAAAVLFGLHGVVQAELLTNGDFEATSFDSGWNNAPAIEHRGLTPTGLDAVGKKAAYMPQQAGGKLYQGVNSGSSWQLDLLFATEDPGETGDRSVDIWLLHGTGTNEQLHLRVIGDGSIDVYDLSTGWENIGGSVSFSVDVDGDNDFVDDGDTLYVHSLRIVGDYSIATPSCDVYLSAANSSTLTQIGDDDLTHFQGTTPSQGGELISVKFTPYDSAGSYVVDQVSLVPEPSTLVLAHHRACRTVGIRRPATTQGQWINRLRDALFSPRVIHRGLNRRTG